MQRSTQRDACSSYVPRVVGDVGLMQHDMQEW